MTPNYSRRSPSLLAFLLGAMSLALTTTIVRGHTTVQDLTPENFDASISDGGLWFVKFYAPWCGHCKKLAPVLDEVAPKLDGKMSIGKVDCTSHKKLCERFNVKGYPTLKIHRDGSVFDYPGGRSADSILAFAERMSSDAVTAVFSHKLALAFARKSENNVAFLAYDPSIPYDGVNSLDEALQFTPMMRTFGEVARKSQAVASFAIIRPGVPPGDVAQLGAGTEPFVAKIEFDVPPVLFKGSFTSADEMSDFVERENLALVTSLEADNFRKVSNMGRMLAVTVMRPEQEETVKAELRKLALKSKVKDKLYFAYIDGVKWERFMKQFGVNKLPSYVIMDYPNGVYYNMESIDEKGKKRKPSMKALVKSWAKGELQPKVQGSGKKKVVWYKDPINYVYVLAVVLMLSLITYLLRLLTNSEEEAAETCDDAAKQADEQTKGGESTEKDGETKKDK